MSLARVHDQAFMDEAPQLKRPSKHRLTFVRQRLHPIPTRAPPAEQNRARGARYYQPGPSPTARSIAPEELELMRRLQEIRDASDLILQFGPHKGSTLAQVAMSNPEYIRQLMWGAQRPEVRAAAGRLAQALDAAAEHKPKARTAANAGVCDSDTGSGSAGCAAVAGENNARLVMNAAMRAT
jgi:hypothetical protein